MKTPDAEKHSDEEPPPFFKSWKGMYFLVIGNLVILIILFYLMTKIFS